MFSCPVIRFSGVVYDKLKKNEKIVFSLFLLITLLQLWLTKYVPSLDGPQHLYNANVLVELIKGNELFQSFFKVNDVLVGYWSGHFLLAFFKFFLPAWLAEKFFLSTYVIAMVFSFRYLVRSMNKTDGNFVSYLIFPFIYHQYLLMGYYTFSIAAIFFFLAFGYWIRHHNNFIWKHMAVFSLLLVGLFLSHGLVYVFFGMAFVVYFIFNLIYDYSNSRGEFKLKPWLDRLWRLALSVGPSLILWVVYIRSIMSINNTVEAPTLNMAESVKNLLRIRPLVGFHHEMESVAYIPLFALIVLLTIVFLVIFIPGLKDKTRKISSLFDSKNAWIFVALVFLGLYLFAPNRISAGSLTNRFAVFFFFSMIAWLSFQKFPKTFQLISLLVILFSITYARAVHYNFYKSLNKDIAEITELEDYMEPNTVVHYQRATHNWTQLHFQLYAACDKAIVHLRNPQCQGQFPVEWRLETLPLCYAGTRQVSPAGALYLKDVTHPELAVDYITVFKKDEYFKDSTNADWWRTLDEFYDEVQSSKNGNATLFRLK